MGPVLNAVPRLNRGTAFTHAWFALLALTCSAQAAELASSFAAGRTDYTAGEFKKAAMHFQQAVKADPSDAEAHFWLGKSYAVLADIAAPFNSAGSSRKARRHLATAVELAPGHPEYRRELMNLLLDSADYSRSAFHEAERLLAAMPKSDPDLAWIDWRLREMRDRRGSAGNRVGGFFYLLPQRVDRLVLLPASGLRRN